MQALRPSSHGPQRTYHTEFRPACILQGRKATHYLAGPQHHTQREIPDAFLVVQGARALECLADHRTESDFGERCGEALRDFLAEAAHDIRTMRGLQADCKEEIASMCKGAQGAGRAGAEAEAWNGLLACGVRVLLQVVARMGSDSLRCSYQPCPRASCNICIAALTPRRRHFICEI